MARARTLGLAIALGVAVAVATAHATVIERMDVEALARAAQVVAVVRVESVEARWEPDRSMIRTHATLSVERGLAGAPGSRLHVSVLGGSLEGSSVEYPAGAVLREGDRLVVFLEKRKKGNGEWLVIGAFQGAFRLEREAETGLEVAVRDSVRDGVILADVSDEDDAPLRLYLDELEARVRVVRGGAR